MGEVDQIRQANDQFLQQLGQGGAATLPRQATAPPDVERSQVLDVVGQLMSSQTMRVIREQIGNVPGFKDLPQDQQVGMVETMLRRSRAIPGQEHEAALRLVQEGGIEPQGIGETGKALLLPTMAGFATGGMSIPVQAGVDVAATATNMALGYEPFSVKQLILAAVVPLGMRGVVRGGQKILQNSKAMAFAKQEAQKEVANIITANMNAAKRQFDLDQGPVREAIKQATQEAKDFIEVQGRKGLVLHRQMVNSIPVQTSETINALYNKARALNPEIDITSLRQVQAEMAGELDEVREVFTRMNDPLLNQLSGAPQDVVGQMAEQFGRDFVDAPPQVQQAIIDQFGGELDASNVVSFNAVVNSIKRLGEMSRSLSKSVATSSTAATDLRHVNRARGALFDALEDAAKSESVSAEASNALKLANLAFKKHETMKELVSFSSQFVSHNAGRETLDATKMLNSLFNTRNPESVELVKNLRDLNLLGGVRTVLRRVQRFQDQAAQKIERLKRQGSRIDVEETRLRQARTQGAETAAQMTPPLSGSPITPPDLQTPIRVAFTAASIGAFGLSSSTDLSPGEAFGITTPIAGAFVTPVLLSGALMTKSGQRFMLRQLADSGGHVTESVAGAMGAFFRATVPQLTASESQPTSQQE